MPPGRGEHLVESCFLKGTARLIRVDPSMVCRLNRRLGEHTQAFHNERVQRIEANVLQADERYGYAGDKGRFCMFPKKSRKSDIEACQRWDDIPATKRVICYVWPWD